MVAQLQTVSDCRVEGKCPYDWFRCFVTMSPSDLCGVVSIRGQRTVDLQLILMTVDSGVNLRICGFEALEMWP